MRYPIRLLILVTLVGLLTGGCAASIQGRGPSSPGRQSRLVLKIRMGDGKGASIVRVRLEDYVQGVVMGKTPNIIRLS